MTDFSNLQITETEYAFVCMTKDRTTAYAMRNTDKYIYRSYDGETWERTAVKIQYGDLSGNEIFPKYAGASGDNEVIIIDQSAYNKSYAIAYWFNSSGVTTLNLKSENIYKGSWQATEGYLYYIEQVLSNTRRYYTLVRQNKAGVKTTLYSLDVDRLTTSTQIVFYAEGKDIMFKEYVNGVTYFMKGAAITGAFTGKGEVRYLRKYSENEYIVISVLLIPNTTNYFNIVVNKFNSTSNSFTEIGSAGARDPGGISNVGVDFSPIKNELHNVILVRIGDNAGYNSDYYYMYELNLNDLSFSYICQSSGYLTMPYDIGAGQIIFHDIIDSHGGRGKIIYTTEGGTAWLEAAAIPFSIPRDLSILQNGTLLGATLKSQDTRSDYIGIKAKFNVKNSGVKIFIDGEKKDLRAYNLTNPDAIRQNKIHANNAQGEHVVLYDREVPEPRKKHVCYFDGEMVRYIYSV